MLTIVGRPAQRCEATADSSNAVPTSNPAPIAHVGMLRIMDADRAVVELGNARRTLRGRVLACPGRPVSQSYGSSSG